MWEINYETPEKLHMSIGAGLLVAGFLLILLSGWRAYDEIDSLKCPDAAVTAYNSTEVCKDILDAQMHLLTTLHKNDLIYGAMFILAGIAVFFRGYIPYIMKKKKQKNPKQIRKKETSKGKQ